MATCFEVADFFIANTAPGSSMTHVKLQKLCSYAKAFSLALLGTPLFADPLQAFRRGPVVRALHDKYRGRQIKPLPPEVSARTVRVPFTDEELFVLETVNDYYGLYSETDLQNMSHKDFPGKFGSEEVIPDDAIRERFASNAVIKAIKEAY